MRTKKARKRGQPGRPPLPMPELPIPTTPEELAAAIMRAPPKRDGEWEYLKKHARSKDEQS